jgi:PAS domain-containing protein
MTELHAASSSRQDRRDFALGVARYGAALLVSAACLAIAFSLPGLRGRPYIVPAVALVLSAWFGGPGPALLTVVTTFVGVNAYVIVFGSSMSTFVQTLQTLGFLAVGVLVVSVTRARAASEREARRQSARLEAMFHQASVGIALVNLDGRLTRMNARMAAIVGRQTEAASSLSLQSLTHQDD